MSPPSLTSIDRRRGAFIGLAVGDALGAAVEFKAPGTFAKVVGYRGGGPHGLGPGEWTDDTSMALALADSIGSVGWDLNDQATRYLSWMENGTYSVNGILFDIGITTRRSLRRFRDTGDARHSGESDRGSSGNGSIMRLAPVSIAHAADDPEAIADLVRRLVESSLPTHGSPLCLSACAYMGVVLAGLIRGSSREDVLAPEWVGLRALREVHALEPEIDEIANGSFRTRKPPKIVGSGYVVRSLEAALWAFHDAPDFETAVLRAVNLGDDADTTGAVCGQFAGACFGESGIRESLRAGLARPDLIEPVLARLLAGGGSARVEA